MDKDDSASVRRKYTLLRVWMDLYGKEKKR